MRSQPSSDLALRRSLTLPWLVLYGLGTTIGAGIYALTGVVADRAGMFAPFAFLTAAIIAAFSALSFAELSARYPFAGGEAVYVQEATGSSRLATLVGVLVVIAGLISAATVSVAFVGYLSDLIPLPPGAALAVVAFSGAVAIWGIKESVTIAGVTTLIETGGLIAIILFGAVALSDFEIQFTQLIPHSTTAWFSIGTSAIICFYAFLGFEDMVNVAEEIQDVRRTLPRAILLTLSITALLYVAVAMTAVLLVTPDELGQASAPLTLVFERAGGNPAMLSLIALVALLNGALIQIIKASRVVYGLSARGMLPQRLAYIHPRLQTPVMATVLITAMASVFATTLPLASLAELTSIITLCTFAAANFSLIVIKWREQEAPSTFKVPLWIPIAGVIASLALLALRTTQ